MIKAFKETSVFTDYSNNSDSKTEFDDYDICESEDEETEYCYDDDETDSGYDVLALDSLTVCPNYKQFNNSFIEENNCSNEELQTIYKSYKKTDYIDIKKVSGYILPAGECVGYAMLHKRKRVAHNIVHHLQINNKKYPVYEQLNGRKLGYIPVNNNRYIVLIKKNISLYTILFPIIFMYLLITSF